MTQEEQEFIDSLREEWLEYLDNMPPMTILNADGAKVWNPAFVEFERMTKMPEFRRRGAAAERILRRELCELMATEFYGVCQ